jgi:hypothetical protein
MKRVQENPCLTARRKQDTTAKLEERNLGRQRRCKDHKVRGPQGASLSRVAAPLAMSKD